MPSPRIDAMSVVSNMTGRTPGRPKKARLPSGEWTPHAAAEGQE
ncbi:MAG: hypothetical protein ACJ8G1_00525 [Vitreoscilla sp.]